MDIGAEITLLADQDLVDRMARLEAMGVKLCEVAGPRPNVRALALVDKDNVLLLTCLVRMEPVEQVREMLHFYEEAILSPQTTRH